MRIHLYAHVLYCGIGGKRGGKSECLTRGWRHGTSSALRQLVNGGTGSRSPYVALQIDRCAIEVDGRRDVFLSESTDRATAGKAANASTAGLEVSEVIRARGAA